MQAPIDNSSAMPDANHMSQVIKLITTNQHCG
jgi:hypothetical protein